MSTITKDLGVVTAYGYYKAGGGTMTEAEFTQFMVDFGTASKTAVDAAEAALESERAAKQSEETATRKASEAGESASTASTKAGEAAQSASDADTAKDDAVTAKNAAETAQGKAEDAAESVSASAAQIATNTADISDIKENLSELNEIIIEKNYIEGYYISKVGQLVADPDYCVTEKIYMTPEMNNSGVFWYGTFDSYKSNVVSFTADGTMVDYWGGTNGREYRAISNFGANVSYIRFTFNKGYTAKFTSSIQSNNSYVTYWEAGETNAVDTIKKNESIYTSSIIGKEGMKKTATSLATGVTLSLDDSLSIKKNKVYHLHSLIDSSFDTLYFGNGEERYSLYFKIDNTNVTFMSNGSEGSSLLHGLTLSTYIDVMLIVGERNTGTLIINTLTGVYKQTVQVVNGYKGAVFVRPSGCTITDVAIEFSCMDFRQPIWMFGDSYFTHTSNDRWTYWLLEWEFGRCLLNGFPGEDSSEALPQVLAYLEKAGTPKYIVWCLGMNDPDSGSVNSSWLECVETLIETCEEKGIEPILSTIPNVPSYTHTYKNAWVKASGYRYIDFAKAVGAEAAGSSWYTGCLSSDNTHPSEYGARLLCLQALLDVSELTLGNI